MSAEQGLKRDGAPIGIDVDMSLGAHLGVFEVVEGGLLADWNQAHPDRLVCFGDHVLPVERSR